MSKIIVFAFPVFLAAMALEWWWDRRQLRLGKVAHSRYAFNDTINSLSLGLLSQVTGVLLKFIGLAAYALAFEHLALFPDAQLWKHWYGWLLALLMYDLCYYGLHRAGHEVAFLWAAHVVHHQSQAYNLSTALRQTSTGGLLGWVFYLPLAVLGVPPLVFGIVGDMGTAIPLGYKVCEQMEADTKKVPFNALLHVGDIAYASTAMTATASTATTTTNTATTNAATASTQSEGAAAITRRPATRPAICNSTRRRFSKPSPSGTSSMVPKK
jgi:hypothetical protein